MHMENQMNQSKVIHKYNKYMQSVGKKAQKWVMISFGFTYGKVKMCHAVFKPIRQHSNVEPTMFL